MMRNDAYLGVRPTRSSAWRSFGRAAVILLIAVSVSGCEPSDRRPGLWLRGEVVSPLPDDWSFTDAYKEIFVQVHTPYWLPHSVTIWCGQVDGNLYIGARDPDSKKWPGWLEENHNIRLKIGDKLYDVVAMDITSENTLNAVRAAYAAKYDLPRTAAGSVSNTKYWAIAKPGSRQ